MAQLTGNFEGSAGADIFAGSVTPEEQTDVNGVGTNIAVKQVIIDTFGGADTIEATAEGSAITTVGDNPFTFLPTNTIGMTNADINTGGGNDAVTISSEGSSLSLADSTGLQNSFIETDSGRDTIRISSNIATGSDLGGSGSTGTGVSLATVSAGADSDTLDIESATRVNPAEGVAEAIDVGATQSTLLGDRGADTITVSSKASGNTSAASTGADQQSNIRGGDGRDSISVSAIAEGTPQGGGSSTAIAKGISGGTFVEGGNGADTIALNAITDAGRAFDFETGDTISGDSRAYGAIDAFVRGDGGSDLIEISGTIESSFRAPNSFAYGVFNTNVDSGNGADTIRVKASASPEATDSTVHGAEGSTIRGGLGSDTIEISAEQSSGVGASVGALNSTVDGGDGTDTIKISGLRFDIQDSLILGGAGDDTFDAGIGAGTVLGGNGADTLNLDFFDGATMSIQQAGTDGLVIKGTADKLGSSASWTQEIFEVESYEVAGTTYDAAGAVGLLG